MHMNTPIIQFLLAISCSCAAALLGGADAAHLISVKNNVGQEQSIVTKDGTRACVCLKNTQTNSITTTNGGVVRLFASNDCTGSYSTIGSNFELRPAHWVNSASWGKGGIPSTGPYGCPNWLA
ncbi:hypothetical protein BG004_001168 [Podila humilis]|nr:hypothetical protein BG004_001168 [Podila humilis]